MSKKESAGKNETATKIETELKSETVSGSEMTLKSETAPVNESEIKEIFAELLKKHGTVRIAALGSSNTQRRLMGMHWFDLVELGLKKTCGKGSVLCCNMGVGGDTSAQILARFNRDVAPFRPHLTIVTCGGNDSNPNRRISEAAFAENLQTLHRKLTELGSAVVFQTYYACDLEQLSPGYAANLVRYMQIVRDTAAKCGAPIVDHFTRWERLRQNDPALYRLLMTDKLHVNEAGNMVLGLDLLRVLGAEIPEAMRMQALPGYFGQKTLDLLK